MSTATLPSRSRLRITLRGRLVVVSAAASVAVVAVSLVAPAPAPAPRPVAVRSAVVAPGDTLWSIAVAAAPDRDPRDEVAAIAAANHLRSSALAPGERLRLP